MRIQGIERTIGSGLRVAAIRHPSVPTVELRLAVPLGGTDPAHAATAELLTAVLLGGADDGPGGPADTDVALGRVGATLRATVTPRQLTVQGTVATDGLSVMLSVLGSCLAEPRRSTDEVRDHRTRLLHRIRSYRAQPAVAAREAMFVHCFPDHPLSREVPSPETVATVTAADVLALHTRAVVPRGSRLLLVGDLDPEAAIATAEQALRTWTSPGAAAAMAAVPAPVPGVSVHSRPGSRQAQIRILTAIPGVEEPGHTAALLANLLLGGYPGARLPERLRERDGLTYSVASWIADYPGRSVQVVSLDTAPHQADTALSALRDELSRLAAGEPAAAREITAARGNHLGVSLVRFATQRGIADSLNLLPVDTPLVTWLPAELKAAEQATDAEVHAAAQHLGTADFGGVVLTAPNHLDEPVHAAESRGRV